MSSSTLIVLQQDLLDLEKRYVELLYVLYVAGHFKQTEAVRHGLGDLRSAIEALDKAQKVT